MEDFNLVLRDLISKDIEKIKIQIPESLKTEFETTAENYLKKDLIFEAIKVFAITKNADRLKNIGEECITKNKPELAFKAFYFAKDKEGLSKAGMEFIKSAETNKALQAFILSENKEMIEFITKNF